MHFAARRARSSQTGTGVRKESAVQAGMSTHERIQRELDLLKTRFTFDYQPDGQWARITEYSLPSGWSLESTQLAFEIPVQYPGGPPYGIYVPAGLRFNSQVPNSYSEPAPTQPPFGGSWGIFSWTTADGLWHPSADLTKGSNLLNWVVGFRGRFTEGV